jgi:hypothetical protein
MCWTNVYILWHLNPFTLWKAVDVLDECICFMMIILSWNYIKMSFHNPVGSDKLKQWIVYTRRKTIKISTVCTTFTNQIKNNLRYHGEYCLSADCKLSGSGTRPITLALLACTWNIFEHGSLSEHVLLCWHIWEFFPSQHRTYISYKIHS